MRVIVNVEVHPRKALNEIHSRSFAPYVLLLIHAFSTALCGAYTSVSFVLNEFVSCAVSGVAKRAISFLKSVKLIVSAENKTSLGSANKLYKFI